MNLLKYMALNAIENAGDVAGNAAVLVVTS